MACKRCASDDLQIFPGELTFAFPAPQRSNLSTVYFFPEFLFCPRCGYTEVRLVLLSDTASDFKDAEV